MQKNSQRNSRRQNRGYNGIAINNIRYADDTFLLVIVKDGLQKVLAAVTDYSQKLGLRLNMTSTKWIVVRENRNVRET